MLYGITQEYICREPFQQIRVREAEELFEIFPEIVKALPNQRMPWAEYRSVITGMLPRSTGWYELVMLLSMQREEAEVAKSWARRPNKGRKKVQERLNTNLTDACYQERLFRGLTRGRNLKETP